jgi:hypothetical protein
LLSTEGDRITGYQRGSTEPAPHSSCRQRRSNRSSPSSPQRSSSRTRLPRSTPGRRRSNRHDEPGTHWSGSTPTRDGSSQGQRHSNRRGPCSTVPAQPTPRLHPRPEPGPSSTGQNDWYASSFLHKRNRLNQKSHNGTVLPRQGDRCLQTGSARERVRINRARHSEEDAGNRTRPRCRRKHPRHCWWMAARYRNRFLATTPGPERKVRTCPVPSGRDRYRGKPLTSELASAWLVPARRDSSTPAAQESPPLAAWAADSTSRVGMPEAVH